MRAERAAGLALAERVYGAHGPRRRALPPHAWRMVRDMTVFDNEVTTLVALRRTRRISADAAGVRRLVIGRQLRARGDREWPGQDLLPGDVISGGASTGHPTNPPASQPMTPGRQTTPRRKAEGHRRGSRQ
jgi:hypothetical protein